MNMNFTIERKENTVTNVTWNGAIPFKEENKIPRIATLTIASIDFQRDLYPKESKENDLEKNIIFLKESDMPDQDKGMVLIAGHSGEGPKAFFQTLDKVKIDDEIELTYLNQNYVYRLVNRIIEQKVGFIRFFRNPDKSYLILTTCMPNEKDKQLILVAEKKN